MSNGDSLQQRGDALEDLFFAQQDAALLEILKEQVSAEGAIAEISRVTGIKDSKILEAIRKLGVSAPTFAALRLFPIVAVAWADGTLEASEREKVEELIAKHAIDKGSPAMSLLHSWLERKPSSELLGAWETYARGLVQELPAEEAKALRETLLGEIKEVAQSAGGVLGWGAISKGEHTVMNQISAALTKSS